MRYALNDAALTAYKTYAGFGTSTLELVTTANGTKVKKSSGTTTLELQSAANGRRAKVGSGQTTLELQGNADGRRAITGAGSTTMELLASQGFPTPVPVPTTFYAAPPSRRIIVAPQPTDTQLNDGRRTIIVPPEDRTILVPPERTP